MPDELSAIWIQRDDRLPASRTAHREWPGCWQKRGLIAHTNENLQPKRFIQEMFDVFVTVRNALNTIPPPGPAIAAIVREIADHFLAKGLRPVVG